jgi:hypothetical protein
MRSFASGRGHARKTPETGTGPCGGLATQPAPEHRCSLLFPPRVGPDGRARYLMLETLRAYTAERLVETGEEPGSAAALAGFAQLYVSFRTVGSHLDRIRDKTGFRRRADLTRLALQAGLI